MRIEELTDNLPIECVRGSANRTISSLAEDSREVEPGALFIARPGTLTDGSRFIDDAIGRGAVAVLTAPGVGVSRDVTHLVCDDVAQTTAVLAERFHGDPSRRLTIIGITGTNGKTTVASLAHQILNRSGVWCGLIGTIQIDTGRGIEPARLTTPPAIKLSAALRAMVDHGCRACVIEVSSHALEQRRVAGLAFDAALFTNLSGDHLDYHGTMEEYAAAKAKLFAMLPANAWAAVNIDDPAHTQMTAGFDGRIVTCSLTDPTADARAEVGALSSGATRATMIGPWGALALRLPLVGRHNIANALQAAVIAHQLGLDTESLAAGLIHAAAPAGRLEPVTVEHDGYTVLVDYAHTDDALDNVLRAVRAIVPEGGRLRVVFGCGGDRDRSKRPRMAQVACRWADDVIITSDNPRTEDPEAIIDDIIAGVPGDRLEHVMRVADRREAIGHVIDTARENDVILIAGKGHEDYQIIGAERHPFDDRTVAAEAMTRRKCGVPAR
jgi:UDP-N-acetylmuramoyl-L-alanyl-D-glutamate--2,6-diaminopimelate ligase